MTNSLIGLSESQVKNLQSQFGFNELPIENKKTLLKLFVEILTEPMFGLLILAGILLFIVLVLLIAGNLHKNNKSQSDYKYREHKPDEQ